MTSTDRRTTLCIVDMQSTFAYTADHCLEAVCRQVKLAIKRKAGIVVIEFRNCGQTYKKIKDLLKPYDRVAYAKKGGMAGGLQLFEAAKKAKFNTGRVRFVGVNRGQCVHATVNQFIGLTDASVEVVARATWCGNPKEGLKRLRTLGSII